MNKQIKRMLALLLSLCLCISCAGALEPAAAQSTSSNTQTSSADGTLSASDSGDTGEAAASASDTETPAPSTDASAESQPEAGDSDGAQSSAEAGETAGAQSSTETGETAGAQSSAEAGETAGAQSSTEAGETAGTEGAQDGEADTLPEQEVADAPLLSYAVVNTPQLSAPDTQEILVGIGDESTLLDQAVLTVRNQDTGETTSYNADQLTAGAALFRVEYTADQAGTYCLESIQIVCNGVTSELLFSDAGISAVYGVDTPVDTDPDGVVTDQDTTDSAGTEQADVVFDVTTMGQGGDQVLADSIEDALNDADLDRGISTMSLEDSRSGDIVIVLDPGHDSTHSGASGTTNGVSYREEELNLKIAQYCKQELEQYNGVKVYLTRTSNSCPNIRSGETSKNVNATLCNQRRVEYAQSVGAQYYISIHLNSNTPNVGTGAEVYYPNANYRPDLGQEGLSLANSILQQLSALGLRNRGAIIKNSQDNTTYPNGSLADYYGVIRRCKEAGICGILVEHAFLTNSSDFANYLSSDAKLQALGVADATGIASYLGLSKSAPDLSNVNLSVSQTANGTLTASVTGVPSNVQDVEFAVWSVANDQDDLVWYLGQRQSDGSVSATIPLSEHADYGDYYIHCYVKSSAGTQFAAGTLFDVAQSTGSASVTVTDSATGAFRVNISGISNPNLLTGMQVAIWSEANGQDDLIWSNAVRDGDSWYFDVDPQEHGNESGLYNIHVYAQDPLSGWYMLDSVTHTVTIQSSSTSNPPEVSAQWNPAQATISLSLSGYQKPSNVTSVRFAVWSDYNGKDDLTWYTAQRQSDGTMTATVSLKEFDTYGVYSVACYAYTSSGEQYLAKTAVAIPTVSASASVTTTDATTGSFRVNLSDVTPADGVEQVEIAVWSIANGQDDLVWSYATKTASGWYADVDTGDHNYESGQYYVHVYIRDTMGGYYVVQALTPTVTVKGNNPTVDAQWNPAEATIDLSLSGYLKPGNVSSVRFAVWSDYNGQDDLTWYTAQRQSDGTMTATVSLKEFDTYGVYSVACYADTSTGAQQYLAKTAVAIPTVSASASVTTTDATTGSFRVNLSDVTPADGVEQVEIAVWSIANGQDDLVWSYATKTASGWYADVDTGDHNYESGQYYVHVYIRDTMGGYYVAQALTPTVDVQGNNPTVDAQWNPAQATISMSLSDYLQAYNVTSVRFAVWSDYNGQDDLTWYTAQRQSDGTMTATASLKEFDTYGVYTVACYALTGSELHFLDMTAVAIPTVSASATVTTTNPMTGSFRVNLSDVTPADGVEQVEVAVWSIANGQDDLAWYYATKTASGWYVDVDTSDHNFDSGQYYVHVYIRDTMGGYYVVQALTPTVVVSQDSAQLTVSMNSNTDYLDIVLSGANLNPQTSVVKFAVWSENKGQDDLVWYTAAYTSGNWVYSVPLANHRFDTGAYSISCYYNPGSGEELFRTATITPYSGARPGNTATAQTIWTFLVNKGMTEAGAAALMGNLFAESGLNASNLQNSFEVSLGYTDANYTAAIDNGSYRYKDYTDVRSSFSRDSAGYGLAQWTYWSRKQALYDYAKANNTSIGDLNMQLNFLWDELNASYPTVMKSLTTTTSVKTASDIVLTQFERPADQSTSVKELRANYGRAYYCYFAS